MGTGVKKSVSGLLVIGMAVQCVLGIWWAILHFTQMPEFQKTTEYIAASENLLIDEYMGILYPLLIAGARGLAGVFGLPFYCFLYVIQIGAVFASLCFCLQACRKDRKRIFCGSHLAGALFLVTVPMVLQQCMAVMPGALCLAVFLGMLGLGIGAMKRERDMDVRFFLQLCGLWAAAALLEPDYLWLAGLPVLWMVVLCLVRKGIRLKAFLISMAALVVILGVSVIIVQPGSYGRIQKTLGAAMVSRMVWPNFDTTYFFWPEEVKAVMSPGQAHGISQYADGVQMVFGPMIEGAYGRQAADAYYWQMAVSCLQVRTREILISVSQDFVDYLCVPWSLKEQLEGRGVTLSGWNYVQMKAGTPLLAKWYVSYSLWMFRVGLAVCIVIGAARLAGARKQQAVKRGKRWLWVCSVACWMLWQIFWYTMSGAGVMDYLNVSVVTVVWYGFLLGAYESLARGNLVDQRV